MSVHFQTENVTESNTTLHNGDSTVIPNTMMDSTDLQVAANVAHGMPVLTAGAEGVAMLPDLASTYINNGVAPMPADSTRVPASPDGHGDDEDDDQSKIDCLCFIRQACYRS